MIMYLYKLSGWEDEYILASDVLYTQKQFREMCLEVIPRVYGIRDISEVYHYLIENKGFKEVNITRSCFIG